MNKNKRVERVVFTLHAEDKLKRLMKIGVTKEKVLKIIENPRKVVNGYYGRKIAQGLLSEDLIKYEESEGEIVVVTRLCILSLSAQNALCDFIKSFARGATQHPLSRLP